MDILWLGQPACHDRAIVGGKAAHLSRLAADHLVPPGFCLTASALTRDLGSGPVSDEEAASVPALPPALYHGLITAYRGLAERSGVVEPSVAVRSSAIDEDGSLASFAGQHETYLNVVGVDAIAKAVVACWASARLPRALKYRQQQGIALGNIRLAVLVQQLVAADISVVLFSANPITACSDEIMINASWGLGESIVGGTVTPDTYVIRKDGLQIVSRRIAEKRCMTVPIDGGTGEVDVPRFLRLRPALDDQQVAELARLGLALESRMGWPVDVECAYQADELFLLQCRPITTLSGR